MSSDSMFSRAELYYATQNERALRRHAIWNAVLKFDAWVSLPKGHPERDDRKEAFELALAVVDKDPHAWSHPHDLFGHGYDDELVAVLELANARLDAMSRQHTHDMPPYDIELLLERIRGRLAPDNEYARCEPGFAHSVAEGRHNVAS